jgi:hypothetical protein
LKVRTWLICPDLILIILGVETEAAKLKVVIEAKLNGIGLYTLK